MQKGLKFNLLNHFRVLKHFLDLFLDGFIRDGFNLGDRGTGSIRFILEIMNNTRYSGKTDTTGSAAGAVQHSATDIIENGTTLKPDSTFL